MDEKLLAGVEIKRHYAEFHLQRMDRSLEPPERVFLPRRHATSGRTLSTLLPSGTSSDRVLLIAAAANGE